MLNRLPYLILALVLGASLAFADEDGPASEEGEDLTPIESSEDASEESDEILQLKDFTITGSRIQGFDIESISPITSIAREAIEATGSPQVSEIVQRMPVTAGAAEADQTLSFAGDGAQANLRGVGVGGTLVLLNGRRIAPYAFATSRGTNFVDLNSIPPGAVERLDILREGGSAIYGSDALGGVINLVLRRDFDGGEIKVTHRNTTREKDLSSTRVNVAYGETKENTNYSIFANYFKRNALQLADRPFSASADHSDEGGFNLLDWASYPGLFEAPTNIGTLLFAGDATNDAEDGYQRFNTNALQTARTAAERHGATFIANHTISPELEAYLELSYQDNRSSSQSSPAAFNRPFTIPGEHPNNPFRVFFNANIDIPNALLRPTDPGPRTTSIRSDMLRIATGLEGQFGKNGKWELSLLHGESKVRQLSKNLVRVDLFQEALNQTEGRILNPFATGPGQGDNALIYPTLMTDDTVTGKRDLTQFSFGMRDELFRIKDRAVQGYVGFEYREESMERIQSELAQNFLLFGSGGTSAKGDRDILAAYSELILPLSAKLEAHAALRFEEYSDFGNSTNPKLGFKFIPIPSLVLRGSVSEAFQAPTLEQAFGGITRGFRQEQDRLRLAFEIPNPIEGFEDDPYPFDDWRSREIRIQGNPNLDPQTATQYNIGATYSPKKLKNLSLGLNAWRIEIDDVIAAQSALSILQDEIDFFFEDQNAFRLMDPQERAAMTNVFRGSNLFYPDAQVQLAPGHISYIQSGYKNFDGFKLEGLDFEAYYHLQTATKGEFTFRSLTQFFDSLIDNGFDFVGFTRFPEFQSQNSINWLSSNRKLRIFYQATYAGSYRTIYTSIPEVGSHILHGLSFTYKPTEKDEFIFAIDNLFDRDPPPLLSSEEGYDQNFGLHDPRGRMLTISYKRKL